MANAAVKNSPFGTTELDSTRAPNLSAVRDGVGGITGMDTITPKEPKPFRVTGEQLIAEASKPIGYSKEDYMRAVTPGLRELESKSRELGEFSAMEKEQQARSKAEATRITLFPHCPASLYPYCLITYQYFSFSASPFLRKKTSSVSISCPFSPYFRVFAELSRHTTFARPNLS